MYATPRFKIAIVAPLHIQPTDEWLKSLSYLADNNKDVCIIIVDDSNGKLKLPENFDVYGYDRQKEMLGEDLYKMFETFHYSSSCKNFGHWLAWKLGFDIVIGIDSDCIPNPSFVSEHLKALMSRAHGWTNPIEGSGWFSRGYPYRERDLRTVGNLGLWCHELDLYGRDRVEDPTRQTAEPFDNGPIRPHQIAQGFLPFSGMNWAVWADAIPALLFLPNFEYRVEDKEYRFRRHDDIWGGFIFQMLMANRNERLCYGLPIVYHDTVVDAKSDANEEEAMIAFEADFFNAVQSIIPSIDFGMYEDMFEAFAVRAAEEWKGTEFEKLIEPILFWSKLFGDTQPEIK